MNKLKVGNWVVDSSGHIGKVTQLYGDSCSAEFIVKGIKAIYHNQHIQFLKPATVLDFIRTMSAKRLADIMAFRTHYFCMNLCSSDDSCRGCESYIEEILEQPLTDETIWKLEGIEE